MSNNLKHPAKLTRVSGYNGKGFTNQYGSGTNSSFSASTKGTNLIRKGETSRGFFGNISVGYTPEVCGKLLLQYEGYLFKRKGFYGSGKMALQKWSQHYFILKDGFLIWYASKPSGDNNYSLYPTGFLPLAGCVINQEGNDSQGYRFQVISEAGSKHLWLRAKSLDVVNDWMEALTLCSTVEFDIARLGEARMTLLKAQGKTDEEEKRRLLEIAKENARRALEENEKKREIMEEQIRERKRKKKVILEQKRRANAQAEQLQDQLNHLEEQKLNLELENEKHQELKGNLKGALSAIQKLQLFVLEYKGPNKQQILRDLSELKEIFNGTS